MCYRQQLGAFCQSGIRLCMLKVRSPVTSHTRSLWHCRSRSQILKMIIGLNHNNIFFFIRILQNPPSHLSLTFPFQHPKFWKTELALGATEWCNASVSLSHSPDMRKILSKDFSLSHVLLLALQTRPFRKALVPASSFM